MKLKNGLVLALLGALVATSPCALGAEKDDDKDEKIDIGKVMPLYRRHCASCHGKDGKGDTKAGKKAGAKDYSDPKFVAKIKDKEAFKKIKEGYKVEGKLKMAPFSKKLKDDQIKVLIKYMKTFAKKKE